ncbi:hypothetical protein ACFW9N_45175 [Streptomyces sp. NPDC059496]|uniref:hypothetical protein n=1 Tax=Streptomyces sp. NPDC059496 TaxID=3346851 RepID=UPI0036771BC5
MSTLDLLVTALQHVGLPHLAAVATALVLPSAAAEGVKAAASTLRGRGRGRGRRSRVLPRQDDYPAGSVPVRPTVLAGRRAPAATPDAPVPLPADMLEVLWLFSEHIALTTEDEALRRTAARTAARLRTALDQAA